MGTLVSGSKFCCQWCCRFVLTATSRNLIKSRNAGIPSLGGPPQPIGSSQFPPPVPRPTPHSRVAALHRPWPNSVALARAASSGAPQALPFVSLAGSRLGWRDRTGYWGSPSIGQDPDSETAASGGCAAKPMARSSRWRVPPSRKSGDPTLDFLKAIF